MAQKLDANLNVISETPIDIQMIGGDLNIISALDDEPNDVGGLTSTELKAKFDEAGLTIQKYINEQLVPAILASDATETARAAAEAERVANEVERVNNENTRSASESTRESAESVRVNNEKQRVANEIKRENAETGYVAQAKKYAEAAEESAQNAIASGAFIGSKNTTLEEYYTAYYTEKRPCFMRRSFGLGEENPTTTFWVMDDVLTGDYVAEESKHAKFYRIHEDGTVLYGKLTADGTFTVTEGKTDTFVGDSNTTASEFYDAFVFAGKACFMIRQQGGSGNVTWVMRNASATANAGAGYVYKANFYTITNEGKIQYGVLSHDGTFTYETASGGGDVDVSGKADASTTTKAGTYGSYDSSTTTYYVPNITVNEQGIVTGASQSYLGLATAKGSSGLMPGSMFGFVYNNEHLTNARLSRGESYADTEISLAIANCKMQTPYAAGGTRYVPSVYGVYAYKADDDSFVPVPITKMKGTRDGTGTVYVNFDRSYLDSSGSADFVVLYEQIYGTSGSSM